MINLTRFSGSVWKIDIKFKTIFYPNINDSKLISTCFHANNVATSFFWLKCTFKTTIEGRWEGGRVYSAYTLVLIQDENYLANHLASSGASVVQAPTYSPKLAPTKVLEIWAY